MLSWVGFSMGTAVQSVGDYFIDEAFTSSAQARYNWALGSAAYLSCKDACRQNIEACVGSHADALSVSAIGTPHLCCNAPMLAARA